MSNLDELRKAVIAAAQGDDPEVLGAAAGRLSGALIREGHGSSDLESLLAELDARMPGDQELRVIGILLRALQQLSTLTERRRAIAYVLKRIGLATYQIDT